MLTILNCSLLLYIVIRLIKLILKTIKTILIKNRYRLKNTRDMVKGQIRINYSLIFNLANLNNNVMTL